MQVPPQIIKGTTTMLNPHAPANNVNLKSAVSILNYY